MAVYWRKVVNKAKRCVIVRFRAPFSELIVNKMVPGYREGVRARRFCQSTRNRIPEWFYYIKLFREDEVVESSLFKKLELTARKMLR